MQCDEDVGKIAQATPVLIGRAMELFLKKLCENASSVALSRQAKTLSTSHLKCYIMGEPTMDFVKDTVNSAPDLSMEPEGDAHKSKKRRSDANAEPSQPSSAGRGRGRPPAGAGGRGRGRPRANFLDAFASGPNETKQVEVGVPSAATRPSHPPPVPPSKTVYTATVASNKGVTQPGVRLLGVQLPLPEAKPFSCTQPVDLDLNQPPPCSVPAAQTSTVIKKETEPAVNFSMHLTLKKQALDKPSQPAEPALPSVTGAVPAAAPFPLIPGVGSLAHFQLQSAEYDDDYDS